MISGGFSRGNPPAHWHSIDTITSSIVPMSSDPTDGYSWPTANLAIYVPFIVRLSGTVEKLGYGANSTGSGDINVGLYDAAGVLLTSSGVVAKTAVSAVVVQDVTNVAISPGIYYVALVASTSSSNNFIAYRPAAPFATALGVYTEAAAMTLPATATFAITQTLVFIPHVVIFLNTVVS